MNNDYTKGINRIITYLSNRQACSEICCDIYCYEESWQAGLATEVPFPQCHSNVPALHWIHSGCSAGRADAGRVRLHPGWSARAGMYASRKTRGTAAHVRLAASLRPHRKNPNRCQSILGGGRNRMEMSGRRRGLRSVNVSNVLSDHNLSSRSTVVLLNAPGPCSP